MARRAGSWRAIAVNCAVNKAKRRGVCDGLWTNTRAATIIASAIAAITRIFTRLHLSASTPASGERSNEGKKRMRMTAERAKPEPWLKDSTSSSVAMYDSHEPILSTKSACKEERGREKR